VGAVAGPWGDAGGDGRALSERRAWGHGSAGGGAARATGAWRGRTCALGERCRGRGGAAAVGEDGGEGAALETEGGVG